MDPHYSVLLGDNKGECGEMKDDKKLNIVIIVVPIVVVVFVIVISILLYPKYVINIINSNMNNN